MVWSENVRTENELGFFMGSVFFFFFFYGQTKVIEKGGIWYALHDSRILTY